jgi:hypothetical protein
MASKIKVDNIENQCGGAVVTKCGATTTISGSVVKANDIQAADGGNLINQCGTTITLGASGDTINLASGASQSGFGRTGTVDWDTTAKTASFTAVSGNGYFVNTTSAAVTMTLPAGSAGDIVGISDYASTFQTNNVTITPNGSDKINGVNENATLSTQGIAVSLVYVDATRGWKSVTGSDNDTTGVLPAFVAATGGTVTCCGDYKIHTFTGPGTFCVSCGGNPGGSDSVDYLVIAGGASGGGGPDAAAGGGAGGYRFSDGTASGCYTAGPSPLGASALPVTVQGYPITVGAGGSGNPGCSYNTPLGSGSNSIFSTITSAGGGGGGKYVASAANGGLPGGSGGGSAAYPGPGGAPTTSGGNGNDPAVSPAQGTEGGPSNGGYPNFGGGGGGATVLGTTGTSGAGGAPGGAGATTSITGSAVGYAGGGGGGISGSTSPSPGFGGGTGANTPGNGATGGTANTGGGAGGTFSAPGTNGGSGIVVIRYKYQ